MSDLKCRFCTYTTPSFYTNKAGQTKSGWNRLQAHIEFKHFDEAERIQESAPTARCVEAEEMGR